MKERIPKFRSDDQERKFRATHDSTKYIDWSKVKRAVFPNLKPSTQMAHRLTGGRCNT
ncbi:MAG: hypothetical protein HY706_09875 [Candidatus Hydrogenedentes bacterium]|nr:hypothetical protein [Candidatus Hydrogenedentota bacterium]